MPPTCRCPPLSKECLSFFPAAVPGSFLAPSPPVSHPLLGHVCLLLISSIHPLLSTPPEEGTDLIFSNVSSVSITPPPPLLGSRAICSPISSSLLGRQLWPASPLSLLHHFPFCLEFSIAHSCSQRERSPFPATPCCVTQCHIPWHIPMPAPKPALPPPGRDGRGICITPHGSLG